MSIPLQKTFKHSSSPPKITVYLIGFLVWAHFLLLGAGAFCSSSSIQSPTEHHSHQIPVTSILCSWACHVGQIATLTTSASQVTFLGFLIATLALPPTTRVLTRLAHSPFAPRGPPQFLS